MKKSYLSFVGALLLAITLATSVFGQTTSTMASSSGGGGSSTGISPAQSDASEQIRSLTTIIANLQAQLEQALPSGATVVKVEDPGQNAPEDVRPNTGSLVVYARAGLTLKKGESQSVFITTERRGFFDGYTDLGLYVRGKLVQGPVELDKEGRALLGPIHLVKDELTVIEVGARAFRDGKEYSSASLAFDVTGVSVHGYTTVAKTVAFQGVFPILGTTHMVRETPPSKIRVSVHNGVPARTVIAGSMGVEGLELVIDSTQANGPVGIRVFGGLGLGITGFNATDTHNVMLYDGSVALNSGSYVLNPSTAGAQQITPYGLFIVQPGITKSLKLKQNISATVTGSLAWSLFAGGIQAVDMVTGEEAIVEVVPSQGPLIQVVRSGEVNLQVSYLFPTTAKANTFAKIASFNITTSVEGVQDGVLTLSIETVDAEINTLGYKAGLQINGVAIGGVVSPQDSFTATVTFSLQGVSIPDHTTVQANLFLDVKGMPRNSAITTWKETPVYMTGQISGVQIPMSSHGDMLGHVVIK